MLPPFFLSFIIFINVVCIWDHVERKVPKYENHKIREKKVKTLTRNWSDHRRIGTQKHTETVTRYFDGHGHLYQLEESKCLWTHAKMASLESWWKVPLRVFAFLSLILWFSYFGTFLSSWSIIITSFVNVLCTSWQYLLPINGLFIFSVNRAVPSRD